jgi:hypothetical protein
MTTTTAISSLRSRVQGLFDQVAHYGATDMVPKAVSPIYNVLLAAAKEQVPGDQVLAEMEPVKEQLAQQAGMLRINLSQIRAALPAEPTPDPRRGTITGDLMDKDF